MKKDKALLLLNQIIEKSIFDDRSKKNKKLEEIGGESWLTFHLKILKELIQDEKI